jgi:hypothetical protein
MLETIVKLVILVVFVVVAVLMWRGWQDKKASPQWPEVDGVITRSEIRHEFDDPMGELSHNAWLLDLQYEYSVQGTPYKGTRMRSLPERFYSAESAQAALKPYPVGQRVRVHHDPAQPGSSVLVPG